MFDNFKNWLKNLKTEAHLFNKADEDVIHIDLASLLFHIISRDGIESDKEKERFCEILQTEFKVDKLQVGVLYAYVKENHRDLKEDLTIINQYLSNKPVIRMHFMDKLNQLIISDGIQEQELTLFNEVAKVIFPDVKL